MLVSGPSLTQRLREIQYLQLKLSRDSKIVARTIAIDLGQMIAGRVVLSLGLIKNIDTFKLKRHILHQLIARLKFPNIGVVDQSDGARRADELLEVFAALFVDQGQV